MATKAKTTSKKTRTTSSRATAAKPKAKTTTTVRRIKADAPARATTSAAATRNADGWFGRTTDKRPALGAILAEVAGTFALASVVIAGSGNPLFASFAFIGITLAIGRLSGAHVNPAITIAAWVTGKASGMRAIGYILAQFIGGMLALVVAHQLIGAQPAQQVFGSAVEASVFQLPALTEGKESAIFMAQILGTGLFAFAVANLWFRKGADVVSAAFTNAFGLFLGLVVAGSYAVLNPAVALALGGINQSMWNLATFVIAPIIGAVIGAAAHKLMMNDVERVEKETA